jgi:MFS family permease
MAVIANPNAPEANAVYRKVTLRLLPFLGLCYLTAYIDRVNVGFAKLHLARELGLSDVAYGLGAGIFFIGYFLFEVPSNLILHRVGAKVWLARIMISWALISAASALLAPLNHAFGLGAATYVFYAIRFLLGAAEAGFFPGVLLYLTYWYPPSRRSLALGQFIIAQPVAFVLGAPLSGLILATCEGVGGLRAWQWMFIIEAIPAALLGIVLLKRLDNRVEDAAWLTLPERALLLDTLAAEKSPALTMELRGLARNGAVWLLALAYFLLVLGAYGLNFWLPSILQTAGVSNELEVGFLTALPYAVGVIVMLTVAARTREVQQARRRSAWMCALASAGLAISAYFSGQLWLMMAGMSLGVAGYLTANALFWRLPGEMLGGRALAAGLAAVNALGNLGGFAGPYLMGMLSGSSSGSMAPLGALAASLALAGITLAVVRTRRSATKPADPMPSPD